MFQSARFVLHILGPRGRCDRKGLLLVAIAVVGLQAELALALRLGWLEQDGLGVALGGALVMVLCFSGTTKRLHDIGLSAWWILAGLAGLVGWSVVLGLLLAVTAGPAALHPGSFAFVLAIIGVMIPAFAGTLWLHLTPGMPGDNRYGPEPDSLGFSFLLPPGRTQFGTPVEVAQG